MSNDLSATLSLPNLKTEVQSKGHLTTVEADSRLIGLHHKMSSYHSSPYVKKKKDLRYQIKSKMNFSSDLKFNREVIEKKIVSELLHELRHGFVANPMAKVDRQTKEGIHTFSNYFSEREKQRNKLIVMSNSLHNVKYLSPKKNMNNLIKIETTEDFSVLDDDALSKNTIFSNDNSSKSSSVFASISLNSEVFFPNSFVVLALPKLQSSIVSITLSFVRAHDNLDIIVHNKLEVEKNNLFSPLHRIVNVFETKSFKTLHNNMVSFVEAKENNRSLDSNQVSQNNHKYLDMNSVKEETQNICISSIKRANIVVLPKVNVFVKDDNRKYDYSPLNLDAIIMTPLDVDSICTDSCMSSQRYIFCVSDIDKIDSLLSVSKHLVRPFDTLIFVHYPFPNANDIETVLKDSVSPWTFSKLDSLSNSLLRQRQDADYLRHFKAIINDRSKKLKGELRSHGYNLHIIESVDLSPFVKLFSKEKTPKFLDNIKENVINTVSTRLIHACASFQPNFVVLGSNRDLMNGVVFSSVDNFASHSSENRMSSITTLKFNTSAALIEACSEMKYSLVLVNKEAKSNRN